MLKHPEFMILTTAGRRRPISFWFWCACICAAWFALCAAQGNVRSLWLDELASTSYVRYGNSIADVLRETRNHDMHPPLFSLALWAWMRMMPYGQFWLKLLPDLFGSLGIFFCGALGYEAGNRRVGLFAAFIAGFSGFCLGQLTEIRNYSLFFMMTALLLYLYERRLRCGGSFFRNLLLGLVMALLAYSHYFGILIIVGLFLSDLLFIRGKRVSWTNLLPYGLGGLLFLPWFLQATLYQSTVTSFWVPKLTAMGFVKLWSEMAGTRFSKVVVAVCLLAALFCLLRTRDSLWKLVPLIMAVAVTVIPAVIYSEIKTSIWLSRYMLGASVVFFFFAALGLEFLLSSAGRSRISAGCLLVILAVMAGSGIGYYLGKLHDTSNEHWREASAWLLVRPDIHRQGVGIYYTGDTFLNGIWNTGYKMDFYFYRHGRYILHGDRILDFPVDGEKFDKLYIYQVHSSVPSDVMQRIQKEFRPVQVFPLNPANTENIQVFSRK